MPPFFLILLCTPSTPFSPRKERRRMSGLLASGIFGKYFANSLVEAARVGGAGLGVGRVFINQRKGGKSFLRNLHTGNNQ
jgi:hypothetical protein